MLCVWKNHRMLIGIKTRKIHTCIERIKPWCTLCVLWCTGPVDKTDKELKFMLCATDRKRYHELKKIIAVLTLSVMKTFSLCDWCRLFRWCCYNFFFVYSSFSILMRWLFFGRAIAIPILANIVVLCFVFFCFGSGFPARSLCSIFSRTISIQKRNDNYLYIFLLFFPSLFLCVLFLLQTRNWL